MTTKGGIVITGASTGIGRACALHLARRGFWVFAGVRRQADGARLAEEADGQLEPLILDITDQGLLQEAVEIVSRALADEPLLGLVNNAGISVNGPLEFVPVDQLRHQLEVNVVSQLAVTQAFLPRLRETPGRLVLMGSVSGLMTLPGLGPYCMSKYALEAMADALRLELQPWGIHVVLIQPGTIDTPIWDKGLSEWTAFEKQAPAELGALYGDLIAGLRRLVKGARSGARPAKLVAEVVAEALTSPRPRTRYLVGGRARQQQILARLPDAWRDRLIRRMIG